MFPTIFRGSIRKRGGLRILVLQLLQGSPKNGAEIMDEIEKMTWGWWRPSPGSIYPLLSTLVEEGLAVKLSDGRYQLTEKGRSEAAEYNELFAWPIKPRTMDDILNEMESYISYMEDMGKDKIIQYKERIESIRSRLERLIQ
mgnify:CR=1 FL=1